MGWEAGDGTGNGPSTSDALRLGRGCAARGAAPGSVWDKGATPSVACWDQGCGRSEGEQDWGFWICAGMI